MTEQDDGFDAIVAGFGNLGPDTQAVAAAINAKESIAQQNELIDLLIEEGLVVPFRGSRSGNPEAIPDFACAIPINDDNIEALILCRDGDQLVVTSRTSLPLFFLGRSVQFLSSMDIDLRGTIEPLKQEIRRDYNVVALFDEDGSPDLERAKRNASQWLTTRRQRRIQDTKGRISGLDNLKPPPTPPKA